MYHIIFKNCCFKIHLYFSKERMGSLRILPTNKQDHPVSKRHTYHGGREPVSYFHSVHHLLNKNLDISKKYKQKNIQKLRQ